MIDQTGVGMLKKWQTLWSKWKAVRPAAPPCFHCAEPVYEAVLLDFDGASRLLCCHGCRAVLEAIAQSGQTRQYLDMKRGQAALDGVT